MHAAARFFIIFLRLLKVLYKHTIKFYVIIFFLEITAGVAKMHNMNIKSSNVLCDAFRESKY